MRWILVAAAAVLVLVLSVVLIRGPSGLNVRYLPGGIPDTTPSPVRGDRAPPVPAPCPTPPPASPAPSTISCGPVAGPGNGTGAGGVCKGLETVPPCGPGTVPGRYYAYSLPVRCDGLAVFDGTVWRSELPAPFNGPPEEVWMALAPDGRGAGFISQRGDVGFLPAPDVTLLPTPGPCAGG